MFAAFFDEHYEAVCRGLTVAFGDARLAEDAVQEAFTRAYVRWRRVSKMQRPAGWVYVTAVRYVTGVDEDHGRSSWRRPSWMTSRTWRRDERCSRRRWGCSPTAATGSRVAVGLDLPLTQVAAAMGARRAPRSPRCTWRSRGLQVILDDSASEMERDLCR